MGSKFRQDSVKRQYTVRNFLKRFLSCGLICLILIACIATLAAFYIMIVYQVEQSIEMGYMKNLMIRSSTLASLKMNDIEMLGSDLSVSAHLLSDLVSDKDTVASQQYLDAFEEYVHDGPLLATCVSESCPEIDGVSYSFTFTGEIEQNGTPKEEWSTQQEQRYQKDKYQLWQECTFDCTVDGKQVFPLIEGADAGNSFFEIRYQDSVNDTVWDESSWYVTPDTQSSSNWQKALANKEFAAKILESQQTCAQASPLFGQSLHTSYANPFSSGSYLGLADVSSFCNSPFTMNSFYYEPMSAADYSCPIEDLPFDYPRWNPKWYSPLCRGWMQEQREEPTRNTLGDLYIFAGDEVFGLTPCAPVLKSAGGQRDFFGALCIDMNPSGPLIDYFPFEDEERAQYLLFNNDEAYDSVKDVGDSSLRDYIEQIIGLQLRTLNNFDTFKVIDIKLWNKPARIYDEEYVTWGRVDFRLTSSSRQESIDLDYWFSVGDLAISFRSFIEEDSNSVSAEFSSAEDASQDSIVGEKQMKLAFFIDGEQIADKIQDQIETLVKDVFYQVLITVLLTTILLIIFGITRVKNMARKMTLQIIHLYETLYQIAQDRKRKGAVELSFKHTSKELNELHLTFNRVARTINLASSSMEGYMTEDQRAHALLSYADAYHIYDEFDANHSQKGVCLANIGSIMMQEGDYRKARQYYDLSIENMQRLMMFGQGDGDAEKGSKQQYQYASELAQNKFILATRYFQQGLAALEMIKKDQPILELLEGKTFEHPTFKDEGYLSYRNESKMNYAKQNALTRSTEVDQLFEDLAQNEYYDRRQNKTQKMIDEARETLKSAIENLDLSEDANQNMNRSVLDCAVYISLMLLEMTLYERILEGQNTQMVTRRDKDLIDQGNWQKVAKDEVVLTYVSKIEELARLQKSHENRAYLTTQEFANEARRGLRVTPFEFCRQYEAYCKGLYMHQNGYVDEAVIHYSHALTLSGRYSNNRMRLHSLQLIEQIVREKKEQEEWDYQQEAKHLIKASQRDMLLGKMKRVGWHSCKSIYKWLSHHYIHRRSIVFIVDSQFDSFVYRDKAMGYMKQIYEGLDPEDFFGFISLDETKQSSRDEIQLERWSNNESMKKRLIRDIRKRENEYVMGHGGAGGDFSAKTIRLERALEKAYEWQSTLVPDIQKQVNGHTFIGPHKWIVCLLGDDVYAVNKFTLNHGHRIQQKQNVSISIMVLSAEAKNARFHAKDYRELTQMSKEGLFCNIVSKEGTDGVSERFLSSMDVYPSDKIINVREFFGGF